MFKLAGSGTELKKMINEKILKYVGCQIQGRIGIRGENEMWRKGKKEKGEGI